MKKNSVAWRRHAITALLAILLWPMASLVQAQTTLRLAGGMGIPLSEQLSDYWKQGVGFGGGVEFPLNDATSVVVGGRFNHFSLDTETDLLSGSGVKVLQIQGNLKYAFSDQGTARPYAIGGAGVHRISQDELKIAGTTITGTGDAGTRLGLAFGGGVDFNVHSDFGLFLEGRVSASLQDENILFFSPLVGIVLR